LQRTWNDHVAKVREDVDRKRSEHDVDRATRNAHNAEDDAAFAVEVAYAAIEEAEYSTKAAPRAGAVVALLALRMDEQRQLRRAPDPL
jgi:hypothetical protein